MIEIQGLSKRYGNKKAVDDISFTVEKGEIIGFLGPNGAGKSTTMNIITGYLPATSGEVKVCGFDVSEDPLEVKKRIGYLPETPPLYMEMTVYEYLDFVCDLKKVAKSEKEDQISNVIETVKIEDVKNRVIKNLSKGYKQRVGIAQALIGKPEVLILDEPTVGLDPNQILEIRELIKGLGQEHTIILSSHILTEVNAVCNKVVIINQGKIVAIDTPQNLSKTFSSSSVIYVRVEGETEKVLSIFEKVEGVKSTKIIENKDEEDKLSLYEIESLENLDIRKEISVALAKESLYVAELTIKKVSLEDVFLSLTRKKEEEVTKDESDS